MSKVGATAGLGKQVQHAKQETQHAPLFQSLKCTCQKWDSSKRRLVHQRCKLCPARLQPQREGQCVLLQHVQEEPMRSSFSTSVATSCNTRRASCMPCELDLSGDRQSHNQLGARYRKVWFNSIQMDNKHPLLSSCKRMDAFRLSFSVETPAIRQFQRAASPQQSSHSIYLVAEGSCFADRETAPTKP
jgi:hypothetical protein